MKKKKMIFVLSLLVSLGLWGVSDALFASSSEMAGMTKKDDAQKKSEHKEMKSKKDKDGATKWYCPMHPQTLYDHPGTDPICGMDLVPLKNDDDMEDMPSNIKDLAAIRLTPWKQQLIGMRSEKVRRRKLHRIIDTVGRASGGKGNFASSAAGFTAKGSSKAGNSQFVIADIFAMDIPYIKVGQEAEIRGFFASSQIINGKVSKIFPYDGTQSRVLRVRIDLDEGVAAAEMFVNVRIKVKFPRTLAIPDAAVIDTGRRRYIFVNMGDGKLMPHEVEIGFTGEDYWEVLSGVNMGDEVVVGANFLVDADSQLKAVLRNLQAGSGGGSMPGMGH